MSTFHWADAAQLAEPLGPVEAALDKGELYIKMASGRWWRMRRNGQTKRWVTRPDHWAIPVKYGLKQCATLLHSWQLGYHYDFKENTDPKLRAYG
jgi:hypothetical protein